VVSFPALKTGAVAQYGSDRQKTFSTQVYRFLDGSEQRFPAYGAVLRRWVIRFDLLDESELVAMEQFFESQGGRAGSFSFTDPWDGTVYPSCRFESDTAVWGFDDVSKGSALVVIVENRI
jgi:phage-related protein